MIINLIKPVNLPRNTRIVFYYVIQYHSLTYSLNISPTECGIITGWILSTVYVGVAEMCDKMLVLPELHSCVLSEYTIDVFEEGEELKSELLPNS